MSGIARRDTPPLTWFEESRRRPSMRRSLPVVFVTGLLLLTVTAAVASSLTSSKVTATPFVSSATNNSGIVSTDDQSPFGHSTCSPYSNGQMCFTFVSWVTQAHRVFTVPNSAGASHPETQQVPSRVDIGVDNSGSRPFTLSLVAENSWLSLLTDDGAGQRQDVDDVLTSASVGPHCSSTVASLLTIAPHEVVHLCLRLHPRRPLAVWSSPNFNELQVAGISQWYWGTDALEGATSVRYPQALTPQLVSLNQWGSVSGIPLIYNVSSVERVNSHYRFRQVLASPTGKILVSHSAGSFTLNNGAEPALSGVVLLMTRQNGPRNQPLRTIIFDAFLDVAYNCTQSGCSTDRVAEDSSFEVSAVPACHGINSYTCVAFDFPRDAHVINGGYDITLWGFDSTGTPSVLFLRTNLP